MSNLLMLLTIGIAPMPAFLVVSESVKYVTQVPILLLVCYNVIVVSQALVGYHCYLHETEGECIRTFHYNPTLMVEVCMYKNRSNFFNPMTC